MTKQEEIREGIVNIICEACMPYICAHWELEPKERLEKCKPLNGWITRILKSESDLGVVIKVERANSPDDFVAVVPLIKERVEEFT